MKKLEILGSGWIDLKLGGYGGYMPLDGASVMPDFVSSSMCTTGLPCHFYQTLLGIHQYLDT